MYIEDKIRDHITNLGPRSLGADLVEKTITLNRKTRSVEHVMSIEPHEVSSFVKNIRNLERALRSKQRIANKKQQQLKMNIRRSLILDQDVLQGQKLGDIKVKFQRLGFGTADLFSYYNIPTLIVSHLKRLPSLINRRSLFYI